MFLLLQFHRQLINLGGKDEIVFRQTAYNVGGQLDGNVTIAGQMQVGMMIFCLSNLTDACEEVKSGRKVLDTPFATNALAILCEPPLRYGPQMFMHLLRVQNWHAAFAGAAMSLGQFRCSNGHDGPPLS